MTKVITSVQNPLIKNILALTAKARERREQGLFVAEGLRETAMALAAGFEAEALLYDPAHTSAQDLSSLPESDPTVWIETNGAVFEKIAYRSGVANVVALLRSKHIALDGILLPGHPLVLVLESVEKPGNLGAILRTADAAGVDAVVLCDPLADQYNPNAIRASLGTVFTVPVVAADSTTTLARFWVEAADERIIIPMKGRVDSLNVSASTAVLLFEARRQRNIVGK